MLRKFIEKELAESSERNLWWLAFKTLAFGPSPKKSVLEYRLAAWLDRAGYKRLSTFLFVRLESRYGIYISKDAAIGAGLRLPHPTGIVIGAGVSIGEDCTIFQQVTVGGKNIGDAAEMRYPKIDSGVVLFAGAKVLGDIRLGAGCTVGANSVVTGDVPGGVTVAGVPAKIIHGGYV